MTRVNDSVITTDVQGGKIATKSFNLEYSMKLKTKFVGYLTPQDLSDDVYTTDQDGDGGTGKSRKEKEYTVKITTPFRKKSYTVCKWIDTGVLEITPKGSSAIILDFGNGDCDNKAKITIAGITKDFNL